MPNTPAPRHDHFINVGEQYQLRMNATDGDGVVVDMTAYTISYKARVEFDSGTVLLDLNSDDSPALITTDVSGNINVDVPASTVAGYVPGTYKFTINAWLTADPENVTRILEGSVEVRDEVVTV